MELAIQRSGYRNRIYMDANATTPPLKRVLESMMDTAKYYWGNPSGAYEEGVRSREKLDWARDVFAVLMRVLPETIMFTSCGTESNNIALRSVMCKAIKEGRNVLITTSVEHPSVKRTAMSINGCEHVQLRVDRHGYVDLGHLEQVLRSRRSRVAMVSIILAQNEVGTLQPIVKISNIVRSLCPGAVIHTDATQIFGKDYIEPDRLGVDMLTGSAHKFHGPRGVGILYAKKGIVDAFGTIMTGGGQERGCRSGTENVPAIVGAAVALQESLGNEAMWHQRTVDTTSCRDMMLQKLLWEIPGLIVNGDPLRGLYNTLSLSFPGVHGHMLAEYLDKQGIAVGSGSACSKGKPSETLQAMYGTSKEAEQVIHSTLRISLTQYTSKADCEYAVSQIVNGWRTLRR